MYENDPKPKRTTNFIHLAKLYYFGHSNISVFLKVNTNHRKNVKIFFIDNIMTYNKYLDIFMQSALVF